MREHLAQTPAKTRDARQFGFAIWGMLCLVISVVGFWPSYVEPLATGSYHATSPMLHWHVFCTMLWLLLLISQPVLIQLNHVGAHRLWGIFGAFVAAGVVLTGVLVQVDAMHKYAAAGNTPMAVDVPFLRFEFLFVFSVCVGLAIVRRNRGDWHKRLIMLGTFVLLQSPLDRMFANVFGLPRIRGLLAMLCHFGLMVLFMAWERRTHGRIHPVTRWGTILIILFILFAPLLALTDWWRQLAARLAET